MKSVSLYNSTLLFLLILLLNCCANNTGKIEKKVYIVSPVDWGQSIAGDTVKITTVCHNLSNSDIFIHYVETPCGCITVVPRSDVIGKNDSVFIDIEYKPAYFDRGYIEKNIFVHLKNKSEPLHFLIRGRIKDSEDKSDEKSLPADTGIQ